MAVSVTTNTSGIIEFHSHEAWRAQTCFALLHLMAKHLYLHCYESDAGISKKSTNPQEVKSTLLQVPRVPERVREKNSTQTSGTFPRGKGLQMIRNLIPHMYVDTSPFILNDPLIQKTAPIRKGIKI